ncbi:MAG: UDP-N-acetylglucosamine 1-carboxyvinyltransferase [Candidatus Andersenbacteria bacterium]|nr:UDP-N-acetylglucosamine 1-carboxyvinyltransferase [Candidatus Andersenbacteria bacterium]
MAKFIISGEHRLTGSIPVYGSKNAALPLLAATLLTDQTVTLRNIPEIRDVAQMVLMLKAMGADVEQDGTSVTVAARTLDPSALPAHLVGTLRGSILLMGALLGRTRTVSLPRPGGDIIGARPIDVHLDGLRQLGARITITDEIVHIDAHAAQANVIVLREFSVTATENIMLLAATLSGRTTIHLAAAEPHVVALAHLLQAMGARISGAGTHTIIIEGKSALHGTHFNNISDMLEAGLFILMAAATGSDMVIENVPFDTLHLFFKKLEDIGVDYTIHPEHNRVTVRPSRLASFTMQSLPYPGIPTDLQAPFAVMATQARGSSLIHDPMYEDRFKHIIELQKMGARAYVCDPHRVVVEGPAQLRGREIPSLDIRAGATLIMAGLVAQGETIIHKAEIIERGYARLTERLQAVGAKITRAAEDREPLDMALEKNHEFIPAP